MNKLLKNKSNIVCICLAILHLGVTFITDRKMFDFGSVTDYLICKFCTLFLLYFFYYSIYLIAFDRGERHEELVDILKMAAPYMVVAVAVMCIKLPSGYISNDENAIYSNAVTLTHDTWFYYITTYYYIISLMVLPFVYGPIVMKVIIQVLTVGYVLYRVKSYFGSKVGNWAYLLFLLYPVIAYTTSAHRLPIYFLIYLDLFVKLLFDGLEQKDFKLSSTAFVIFTGAVLTQWRTEGIYLAALIPILVFIVYRNMRKKKYLLIFLATWIIVQYLISIPQNGFTASGLDDAANDRMKPFYAYTITNMYRNGLDLEKNAQDLAIVDKYMSLEMIKAINEHYVDINYEDVLILYQEGFIGVRSDASVEDFINYSDAVKRIFINNPDVFARTRWGAFCYAARPYHIAFSGFSIKGLISFGISVVKSIMYNLFIPLTICFAIFIYSLFKRKWYTFFVFGGLLAHWFIVFVLAPASYFKYYFPIYIMAYFYLIILGLWIYRRRKDEAIASPLW